MVESSVSSIYRSLPSWEIQVNIEVYSSTFFAHLEVLMIWLYSRVIVLDLWDEKDGKWICLKLKARAMQGNPIRNPGNLFGCSIWNLGNFDEGIGILGFGIRIPRRGIQNPELSWIPLYGTTRRCPHQRCSVKLEFIDDFILFIRAASLAMKTALGEIF